MFMHRCMIPAFCTCVTLFQASQLNMGQYILQCTYTMYTKMVQKMLGI